MGGWLVGVRVGLWRCSGGDGARRQIKEKRRKEAIAHGCEHVVSPGGARIFNAAHHSSLLFVQKIQIRLLLAK